MQQQIIRELCKKHKAEKITHIKRAHQQLIHAGLAFFQVDPLYGHALLSGGTEGCLHHSCGPAAWNHSHTSASAQGDMSQEGLASHAQLEDFTFQQPSEAFVFR